MAPNNNNNVIPTEEFVGDAELPVEEFDAEGYYLLEVRLDGSLVSGDNIILGEDDDDGPSELLIRSIYNISMNSSFIACINCIQPIAMLSSIDSVVMSTIISNIIIAYGIHIYDHYSILGNALIDFLPTPWACRIHCRNCGIMLSVPALTVYNNNILSIVDHDYVVLDASAVILIRKVEM